MNALAQELQYVCAHAPLEKKRVSTVRLALKLVPLPQRECGEKTAVNAKRMLANISPFFFFFFYPILPFPLSISPDHLLPAVTACGKRPGIV